MNKRKEFGLKMGFDLKAGDEISIVYKIDKDKSQNIKGVVLETKEETFRIRNLVQKDGFEIVIPFNSPKIISLTLNKRYHVRQSRPFYLREDKLNTLRKIREK